MNIRIVVNSLSTWKRDSRGEGGGGEVRTMPPDSYDRSKVYSIWYRHTTQFSRKNSRVKGRMRGDTAAKLMPIRKMSMRLHPSSRPSLMLKCGCRYSVRSRFVKGAAPSEGEQKG